MAEVAIFPVTTVVDMDLMAMPGTIMAPHKDSDGVMMVDTVVRHINKKSGATLEDGIKEWITRKMETSAVADEVVELLTEVQIEDKTIRNNKAHNNTMD